MQGNFKKYYAVIFTSIQSENTSGYAEMAEKMEALAKAQSGYLGMDHARSDIGVTISYWESLEAIANWKKQQEHLIAQQKGRELLYKKYSIRICRVEREYHLARENQLDEWKNQNSAEMSS